MFNKFRRTVKKFNKLPVTEECQFCNPQQYAAAIYQETAHAYVIANRIPYDHWELRRVTDHRMVIPKRHVTNMGDLNAAERADIMDLIAEHESKHYDIFARFPKSPSRSQTHQHTHLIKTEAKPGRGMFFWYKPYILWLFK